MPESQELLFIVILLFSLVKALSKLSSSSRDFLLEERSTMKEGRWWEIGKILNGLALMHASNSFSKEKAVERNLQALEIVIN